MGKYIDADKVKEYILSTGFYCDTEADRKYSAELIDELFPTADVVEVVRCKDCDMWSDSFEVKDLGKLCMNFRIVTKPDFYCAWGSRE